MSEDNKYAVKWQLCVHVINIIQIINLPGRLCLDQRLLIFTKIEYVLVRILIEENCLYGYFIHLFIT